MLGTHQGGEIGVFLEKRKKKQKNYGDKQDLFVSGDRIQKFFGLKGLQIKMGLELFHKVPAGAIETLFNDQDQLFFQKADLGNYLGIEDIKNNFKDFSSQYTRPRLDLKGVGLTPSIGRTKNPHGIFINLDGSVKMVVRSKNPRQFP